MDQDGETELLLIGAPLFYGEQRGGRVFIYQKKQVRTRSARRWEKQIPSPPRSQVSPKAFLVGLRWIGPLEPRELSLRAQGG